LANEFGSEFPFAEYRFKTDGKALMMDSEVLYYLPSVDRWQTFSIFMRRHKRMMELAQTVPAPFIFRLARNGQFYSVPVA
jgi:hypothetical protein